METHGSISAAEASAALASVERSRARVAWSGYPAWYWFGTAAGLASMSFATSVPDWLGLLGCAVVAAVLIRLAIVAGRARGVCEGWTVGATRARDVLVLYGPAMVVLLVGSFTARLAWWVPVVSSVLVFVLFAGAGLALGRRAARR